eukprot:3135190-Rhodomonas_salina.2
MSHNATLLTHSGQKARRFNGWRCQCKSWCSDGGAFPGSRASLELESERRGDPETSIKLPDWL